MSVEVKKLSNEPIIIFNFIEPLDVLADITEANTQTAKYLHKTDETLYRIDNLLGVTIDFGKLVEGMARATRAKDEGSLRNDRVKTILVTHQKDFGDIMQNGFQQDQYGSLDIKAFSTLDDALNFARKSFD
ncbi:MAG: hypothetical protein AAFY41_08540 [Bacteroidota bacterium]